VRRFVSRPCNVWRLPRTAAAAEGTKTWAEAYKVGFRGFGLTGGSVVLSNGAGRVGGWLGCEVLSGNREAARLWREEMQGA
jgi:hypothetical protein